MAKEVAILTVSVVALMLVGFAAYEIYNYEIPTSQPAEAEVKYYAVEFESIQTALSQVNKKLETLESDTMKELQQIKAELEQVKATTEQTTLEPSIFGITTDKSIYSKGSQIQITGQGAEAQRPVKLDLFSSFDELITSKTAYSDSTGKLAYVFELPSYIQTGDYSIKATHNGKVDTESISITANVILSESESAPPSDITPAGVTMILDQEEYRPGDIIRITGIGQANTSVDLRVTDPNEAVTTMHSSTNRDGTYTVIYILPSDAKTGNWQMTLLQDGEEAKITVRVAK